MPLPRDEILARLRSIRPQLQPAKLVRLRLFGSVARGTHTDQSDVDLLLDFNDTPSLFDLCEIQNTLENALGMPVDLAQTDQLLPPLRSRILQEATDV
jgi:uncharacterized protein